MAQEVLYCLLKHNITTLQYQQKTISFSDNSIILN